MKIELTSTAFGEGDTIPKEFTADGKNVSPPLQWATPPEGTKSLVLICDDPDAPSGTWFHWVLYDLPAETRGLEQGVPVKDSLANGARQGFNGFGKTGYGGPAPPKGKPHRYFFKLYALDTPVGMAGGAPADHVLAKMKGHILGEGQLMGRYGR
jgi:Raf kinase inhibitor-like YbhB/YbcL family protein